MKQVTLFNRFKHGVSLGVQSFALLWHHPVLLIYYLGLIAIYALTFIISFNVIGHLGIDDATSVGDVFSDSFNTPDANILANVISPKGGLVYIGYIASYVLNIFLRTLISFALIYHAYALITQQPKTIADVFAFIKRKWLIILNWSLVVTAVTLATNVISFIGIDSKTMAALSSSAGIVWTIMTFMIIPILALKERTISHSFYRSTLFFLKHVASIAGGVFWIGLVLVVGITSLSIILAFFDKSQDIVLSRLSMALILLSPFFATVLGVFKTKLYAHISQQELAHDDPTPPDYSQF